PPRRIGYGRATTRPAGGPGSGSRAGRAAGWRSDCAQAWHGEAASDAPSVSGPGLGPPAVGEDGGLQTCQSRLEGLAVFAAAGPFRVEGGVGAIAQPPVSITDAHVVHRPAGQLDEPVAEQGALVVENRHHVVAGAVDGQAAAFVLAVGFG